MAPPPCPFRVHGIYFQPGNDDPYYRNTEFLPGEVGHNHPGEACRGEPFQGEGDVIEKVIAVK
jgi:hypothetical protein